jgi:hypothetical protein
MAKTFKAYLLPGSAVDHAEHTVEECLNELAEFAFDTEAEREAFWVGIAARSNDGWLPWSGSDDNPRDALRQE